MQSHTSTNTTFLERLAVARLQHTVNELQTQVDHDRTLQPPIRKVLHCICDDTALTASISDLKRFVADKSITMIVPFSALDSLDRLKKGTDDANLNARESIRFFDRVQTAAGRRQVTGVMIQAPTEKYANWEECITAAAEAAATTGSLPPAAAGAGEYGQDQEEPPNRIKELLNCVIYHLNKFKDRKENQVLLVTNDEIVREWAELYNIHTIASNDIGGLTQREEIEFTERKRHYEFATNHPRSPSSPHRGGRGGGRGGRGGGFARRDGWKDEDTRVRSNSNGNSNGNGRGRGGGSGWDQSPPDFVLRGPPRGVARGRGKLWEP